MSHAKIKLINAESEYIDTLLKFSKHNTKKNIVFRFFLAEKMIKNYYEQQIPDSLKIGTGDIRVARRRSANVALRMRFTNSALSLQRPPWSVELWTRGHYLHQEKSRYQYLHQVRGKYDAIENMLYKEAGQYGKQIGIVWIFTKSVSQTDLKVGQGT